MKHWIRLLVLGFVLAGTSTPNTSAQGYVVFRNFDQNLTTYQLIYDFVSGNPLTSEYWAQLYVGPADVPEFLLISVGSPQALGDVPFDGLVIGGEVANPCVKAGEYGSFQMRVWPTNYATWESAEAASNSDPNIHTGKSSVFQNITGPVGFGAEIVYNLPPFGLGVIPEPSLIGASVLGTAFFIRRRRRQTQVSRACAGKRHAGVLAAD